MPPHRCVVDDTARARRRRARIALLCSAWLLPSLIGCASAPRSSPAQAAAPAAQELPEPAALSLLDRLLLEQRQRPVEGWRVRLQPRTELEVDLRLGDSHFGVEWVSGADRASYGDSLPGPDPGGQLRVVRGEAASEPALILLLDDRNYRLAQAESRVPELWSERERALEDRLRRDLRDFIDYAQGQYAL